MNRFETSVLAFVVAITGSVPALATSKSEAREELKTKHFITYDNGEQFNKAFLEQKNEVVRLFFEAHGGFPGLEPATAFNDALPPPEDKDNALGRYLNHAIALDNLEMVKMFVR